MSDKISNFKELKDKYFSAVSSRIAVPWGADLSGADLSGANLRGADLSYADLSSAYLRGADLSSAYLISADLISADLRGANLRGAYLRSANLRGADLSSAYLRGADLSYANLTDAKLPNFLIVPEVGPFYAYKKLSNGIVAELYIPRSAKRTSSLVGRKCRASKVKVVALFKDSAPYASAISVPGTHDPKVVYAVGQWVHPDKYDDDIRVECTSGIHFFMTKKEAEEYN